MFNPIGRDEHFFADPKPELEPLRHDCEQAEVVNSLRLVPGLVASQMDHFGEAFKQNQSHSDAKLGQIISA